MNYSVIDVGGGASMAIPGENLEWALRYGNALAVKYEAATVIASYDHLLSLSNKEILRRISLVKAARRPK